MNPWTPGTAAEDAATTVPPVRDVLAATEVAWETSPALVSVTWGPQHLLTYQNAASARVFGQRRYGVPLNVAWRELGTGSLPMLDRVLETGEVLELDRREVEVRDVAGDELVLHYVVAPLGDGPPHRGIVMTAVNVTGEVRAEQSVARARLVAEITEGMSTGVDPDAALQTLADRLVPDVADLAVVYITAAAPPEGGRPPASTAVAFALQPGLAATAGPPPPPSPREGPTPWDAALAAGQTVLIDVAALPQDTTDRPGAAWLAAVAGHTIAVVPLVVAGELAGALLLLAAGDRKGYQQTDVAFLEDVTARAGAAIAHLRSYQQQRQIALNLQRALLPSIPPALPGFDVAARYVAGSGDVEVGGDWWDVHHLGDGRIGIGVGDVSGRGVPAAVLMGQARSGMRAAAHADLGPGRILTVLDAQVEEIVQVGADAHEAMPPKFATAAYAIFEPAGGGVLRIANAGHPPLLVRYPTGEVAQVAAPPGAPLGVGVGGYAEITVPFPPGTLLVAYTDGLVESRSIPLAAGIATIAADLAAFDPTGSLDELADTMLTRADVTDDTALVILRFHGS
ncbi:MAG: hypothetical protein QOE19_3575 [Actinomycetota bacterium]|nr:hypothetical protein [Actinomycetota bacterium]MDQ1667112.1 hypothetical protein [Actinomycetota bacterium]